MLLARTSDVKGLRKIRKLHIISLSKNPVPSQSALAENFKQMSHSTLAPLLFVINTFQANRRA